MAVLNVWSNLIQHEGNDVRLHSQEQDIAFTDCLFVAGGEVNTQFLYIYIERERSNVSYKGNRSTVQTHNPKDSVMGSGGLAVYTPAVPAPWGDLFQGRWL